MAGMIMDFNFERVLYSDVRLLHLLRELRQTGFVLIPGPLSEERVRRVAASYDRAMASSSGSHYNVGTTTTRMSDLLCHDSVFEAVFVHRPLLDAAMFVIGEPIKLSSLLGRTVRGETVAQELHADSPRDSRDAPLVGFIFMIDRFHEQNGATRFVPGSHRWHNLPADVMSDTRETYPGEVLACGNAGTLILFDGAIWHGHTANSTPHPRRSIQGYFIRRTARSGFDFPTYLPPATRKNLSQEARHLLSIPE